jgi:hypothetical protein
MKRNLFTCLAITLITILTLSACAQPANSNTPVEEAPLVDTQPEEPEIEQPAPTDPVETPEQDSDDEDARMEALISEKIEDCHMLNFILTQTKTAEEWSTTIDRMIGKGANINPEEKEMIINWLVSRN